MVRKEDKVSSPARAATSTTSAGRMTYAHFAAARMPTPRSRASISPRRRICRAWPTLTGKQIADDKVGNLTRRPSRRRRLAMKWPGRRWRRRRVLRRTGRRGCHRRDQEPGLRCGGSRGRRIRSIPAAATCAVTAGRAAAAPGGDRQVIYDWHTRGSRDQRGLQAGSQCGGDDTS